MAKEKLAILGGERTVTLSTPRWPAVGDEEIDAVTEALKKSREDTRYLSAPAGGGPIAEFEERFAAFMGARYALSMSGGGPALHTAVMASGAECGDEIIVSTYTWGQTVSCILQHNGIPIFADIDPKTYNLDPDAVEARITDRTKAIVVVHLYGNPADMDPIMAVAEKHGLIVIEDCAQAIGAVYKGRRVGSIGHFGCFSIGDGKNMVGGEGGMLVTNDHRLYQQALLCGHHPARHNQDLVDEDLKAWSDSLIYTYRMHPLCAVIANIQIDSLDGWNAERRANADRLSAGLSEIPGIEPPYVAEGSEHIYHIYSPSFVPEELEGVPRERFVEVLQAEGVPISTGYVKKSIHLRRRLQERQYFYGKGCPWTCGYVGRDVTYHEGDCPVAEERCANRELTIGGSTAWRGDQREMIDQYLAAFRKVRNNLDVLRQRSGSS